MGTVTHEDRQRWTDAELLTAASKRDGAAFSVFYRRYLPAVIGYLLRETGDRELAADIAAEVFSAVLVSAGRYRPVTPTAMPWVIAIARNKLLMSYRRGRVEARARRSIGMDPIALSDVDLDAVERLADGAAGPVGALVDELPEDERTAVRARVLDERSYGDIARELHCSEMVVRKRVSRGLARVRDRIGEREGSLRETGGQR